MRRLRRLGDAGLVGRRAKRIEIANVAAVLDAIEAGILLSGALIPQREAAVVAVHRHAQVGVLERERLRAHGIGRSGYGGRGPGWGGGLCRAVLAARTDEQHAPPARRHVVDQHQQIGVLGLARDHAEGADVVACRQLHHLRPGALHEVAVGLTVLGDGQLHQHGPRLRGLADMGVPEHVAHRAALAHRVDGGQHEALIHVLVEELCPMGGERLIGQDTALGVAHLEARERQLSIQANDVGAWAAGGVEDHDRHGVRRATRVHALR